METKQARRSIEDGSRVRFIADSDGKGVGSVVFLPKYRRGVVVEFDSERKRYVVTDCSTGEKLLVHPRNIWMDKGTKSSFNLTQYKTAQDGNRLLVPAYIDPAKLSAYAASVIARVIRHEYEHKKQDLEWYAPGIKSLDNIESERDNLEALAHKAEEDIDMREFQNDNFYAGTSSSPDAVPASSILSQAINLVQSKVPSVDLFHSDIQEAALPPDVWGQYTIVQGPMREQRPALQIDVSKILRQINSSIGGDDVTQPPTVQEDGLGTDPDYIEPQPIKLQQEPEAAPGFSSGREGRPGREPTPVAASAIEQVIRMAEAAIADDSMPQDEQVRSLCAKLDAIASAQAGASIFFKRLG